MDRRHFIKSVAAGSAMAGALGEGAGRAEEPQLKRPNFLFMIADDLTFRAIGAMGNHEAHTPNLDRLVSSGCAFTHCFQQGSWTPAVCVASRMMLNTGLTTFRVDRPTISDHTNSERDFTPLWGQTLRNAGYHS
ncbi:MAG: sulfatase-like hydrolase/transferase, partial [Bryobacteraceae bacterium]